MLESFSILFHPDFNRRLRNLTASAAFAGRGLYHRWGISPRPENYVVFIIVHTEFLSTKITKN